MLDNIADLVLTVSLLGITFGFPTTVALTYMVPGTAIGVFVGDLLFFIMAIRVAKRTGRTNLTAMPLGLDTPSTIGMVFFVLGPAYLAFQASGLDPEAAAIKTWHVGICSIVLSGVFKILCAFGSGWIRQIVPRAGLLGSLAAVALVLISFLPALEVLHLPIVGFMALAVVLTTLVARIRLPFKLPGALGALLIAGSIYYLMLLGDNVFGWHLLHQESGGDFNPAVGLFPTDWLSVFRFEWTQELGTAVSYLPIVLPFALATVIGGIDCTESAAAAGDEFDTKKVIGVEAIATLVAGLCGGVIQTTPYIGHPAYKAMGGRAAYTLATAIFVGSAGVLGYFGYLYALIPKATVFPILIFIGLEITAQSFRATKTSHYPAVVLGCIPALASLVMIFIGNVQGQYMGKVGQLSTDVDQFVSSFEAERFPQSESITKTADQQLTFVLMNEMQSRATAQAERVKIEQVLEAMNARNQSDFEQQVDDAQSVDQWNEIITQVEQSQSDTEEILTMLDGSRFQRVIDNWRQSYEFQLAFLKMQRDVSALEAAAGNPAKGIAARPDEPLGSTIQTLLMLSNNFILTSLIWASALATLIDRRLASAAIYFAVAAGLTLFGVIHSPLPDGAIFLPWNLSAELRTLCFEYVAGYLIVATFLVLLGFWLSKNNIVESEIEHLDEVA